METVYLTVALRSIPQRDQEALFYRHIEGFSYERLMEIYDVERKGTMVDRLYRYRLRLGEALIDAGASETLASTIVDALDEWGALLRQELFED